MCHKRKANKEEVKWTSTAVKFMKCVSYKKYFYFISLCRYRMVGRGIINFFSALLNYHVHSYFRSHLFICNLLHAIYRTEWHKWCKYVNYRLNRKIYDENKSEHYRRITSINVWEEKWHKNCHETIWRDWMKYFNINSQDIWMGDVCRIMMELCVSISKIKFFIKFIRTKFRSYFSKVLGKVKFMVSLWS